MAGSDLEKCNIGERVSDRGFDVSVAVAVLKILLDDPLGEGGDFL